MLVVDISVVAAICGFWAMVGGLIGSPAAGAMAGMIGTLAVLGLLRGLPREHEEFSRRS